MKKTAVLIMGILFVVFCSIGKSAAESTKNNGGFCFHEVKKGETLWKLFGKNWKIVATINRVSPDRLKLGMILLIPCKWENLDDYSPLPKKKLNNAKSKFVLIDLKEQVFGAYENGRLAFWGPISSGRTKFETPAGNFKILQKDKNWISKSYPKPNGGTPMPYALKFYGNYWIHAGPLPGEPDSHGCIRLMDDDAKRLFQWAVIKTPVEIM